MKRRTLVFGSAALAAFGRMGQARAAPGPADVVKAAWPAYRSRFIDPDGRLADDANGKVSHSEGQGYAMLLAAAADDHLTFARLWGWTARELYIRDDGLASWRWVPGKSPHVTDPNNATDGDLLIAWGLARAARRWNSPEYAAASRRIALAVGRSATFQGRYGLMLRPGVAGFGTKDKPDGPVVNLSYWVFPAFPALKEVAPEVDWDGLTSSGLALLEAARFGPQGLPCDWISVKGEPAPSKDAAPTFGYDAVRVPLYLAWAGVGGSADLDRFASLAAAGTAPPIVDVRTGSPAGAFADAGYRAVFALAGCAASGHAADPSLFSTVGIEQYFPTSLHLLALLAAAERGLSCG